jgi:hypothetical protein
VVSTQIRTIETMLLTAQWERAKGELRAMTALQGSYPSHLGNTDRWESLRDRVEQFIIEIEGEALQEAP